MISYKRRRVKRKSRLVVECQRELWLAQPRPAQVLAVLPLIEPADVHEIARAVGFPTWASEDGQASEPLKQVVRAMLAKGLIRKVPDVTTIRARDRRVFYAMPRNENSI